MIATVLSIILAMTPAARQIVQFAPTGKLAVSNDGYVAMFDGAALHFWHLASRALVRTIPTSALAADGDGLISPQAPSWNEATHELVLLRANTALGVDVEGHTQARPLSASRLWPVPGTAGRARWLARNYGEVEVLDVDLKSIGKLAGANTEDVAIAADGKTATVLLDKALVRYALDPIAKQDTIALPGTGDHAISTNQHVAVSRDGAVVAACMTDGQHSTAILVRGGKITPLAFPQMAGCQVWLADAYGLVLAADAGELHAFDLASGAARWSLPLAYDLSNAMSSDLALHDRTMLIAYRGLTLVDIVHGEVIGSLGAPTSAPADVWFLKGDALLVRRTGPSSIFGPRVDGLARWSLATGTLVERGAVQWGNGVRMSETGALAMWRQQFTKTESCIVFSRGTAATGAPVGDLVKVWPPAPGKSVAVCQPLVDKPRGPYIAGVDLETGAVAWTDDANVYRITRATGGAPLVLANTPKAMIDLQFSADGRWAFGANTRGSWGSLDVWNAKTGARQWFTSDPKDTEAIPLGGGTRAGYYAHAVSADGTKIAVGGERKVTVYTLADKRALRTLDLPGTGYVTAVAFAGAGDAVVVGTNEGRLFASRPGVAKLGDALATDGGALQRIEVRGDGARAVTVSDDGALRVWDLKKPALLATLVEFDDGESFASTPGGAFNGDRETADRISWVFDGPTEGFSFERYASALVRPDIVAKRLADATTDLATAIVRPPRVTLTKTPPKTATAASLSIAVHVEGPTKLATLSAYVAGRPVGSSALAGTAADATIAVPLEPGANVVTLVAFDAAGVASNPLAIEVVGPATKTRPDVWVVAVGVGWYPNLPPEKQLEGSVNDAYAIGDAFSAQAGAGKAYAAAHVTVLEDEHVTPEEVDRALAGLAAAKPGDLAIVFLAGHGVQVPKTNDMVLLTHGATAEAATLAANSIGWTRIGAALQRVKARVVVLLDACHAGNVSQQLVIPNTKLANDLVTNQRAGAVVFAASKGYQVSLEENAARALVLDDDGKQQVHAKRPPKQVVARKPPAAAVATAPTPKGERNGHGYFTGAVLAALDAPVTDTNHDGAIELSELIEAVRIRVVKASRGAQTPWVARRELFGDFAIGTAAK